MPVIWRFEYTTESGTSSIEFDRREAARLIIRDNCRVDVQRYKSGLVRIYHSPVLWKSGEFTIRQVGGTFEKVRSLARLTCPLKIYYRYHVDQALFINAGIIPERSELFVGGNPAAGDLVIRFAEISVDRVAPGLLYFPHGGYLNGNMG